MCACVSKILLPPQTVVISLCVSLARYATVSQLQSLQTVPFSMLLARLPPICSDVSFNVIACSLSELDEVLEPHQGTGAAH